MLGAAAAQAQTVALVQTQAFSFSDSGTITIVDEDGFTVYPVLPTNFFSATFQPFNSTLGTLESISLNWSPAASATNTGTLDAGMFLAGGGTVYIGDNPYNGLSGGFANSSTGEMSFTATANNTWPVVGFPGNPALLALFTGDNPFGVRSDANLQLSFSSDDPVVESYTMGVTGGVTLTYNYIAAVPEPSTYAALAGAACMGAAAWMRRKRRHTSVNIA